MKKNYWNSNYSKVKNYSKICYKKHISNKKFPVNFYAQKIVLINNLIWSCRNSLKTKKESYLDNKVVYNV